MLPSAPMKLLMISHGRLISNGTAGQAVLCGMAEAAISRGWRVSHLGLVKGPSESWETPHSFEAPGVVAAAEVSCLNRVEHGAGRGLGERLRRYIDHLLTVYDPTRVTEFAPPKPALLNDVYDGVIAFEPLAIELAKSVTSKRVIGILGDPTGRRTWHSSGWRQLQMKMQAVFWDLAEPYHFRRSIPGSWQIAMFGTGHAALWKRLLGRSVVDLRPSLPVKASTADAAPEKIVVLFGGTLTSTASRQSLDPLFDEIIPSLRAGFAGKPFELRLVGECPEFVARRAVGFPEVRILGKVASFEQELAKGHIFLLPMNYPVGVRTRVCSALAAGNVCIVHPSILFNMPELEECPAVIVEQDISSYASIIEKAVSPETFRRLRAAARLFFSDRYSARVAAAPLLDWLEGRSN